MADRGALLRLLAAAGDGEAEDRHYALSVNRKRPMSEEKRERKINRGT